MIVKELSDRRPEIVLDVGCGCGNYTLKMLPFCKQIIAIDLQSGVMKRVKNDFDPEKTQFLAMNAAKLAFADSSMEVVCERASLHHIRNYEAVMDEMIRVARKTVLVEEPIGDDNETKKYATMAHDFYLGVQRESGLEHYSLLTQEQLERMAVKLRLSFVCRRKIANKEISFKDYFADYESFAGKTKRKDYWMNELKSFESNFPGSFLPPDGCLLIISK